MVVDILGNNTRKALIVVLLSLMSNMNSWSQTIEKDLPEMPAKVHDKVAPAIAYIICNERNNVGSGSVVGVSTKGHAFVLTACHVVASNFDAARSDRNLRLTFHKDIYLRIGGQPKALRAYVLKGMFDLENDLALLATTPVRHHELISYNHSDGVKPGQKVAAFGFPDSYELTQTVGRIEQNPAKYFAFDARLDNGNSGGPLVDNYGRMIGMAIKKGKQQGYALQMNLILSVVEGWFNTLEKRRLLNKKWKRQKYGSFSHRFYKDPKFLIPQVLLAGGLGFYFLRPSEPDLPGPPGFPDGN